MTVEKGSQNITRIGVYGVIMSNDNKQMLLIRQYRGPYAGKFDFPGGGIEFGESPEEALRRELIEEVAMECDSLQLIENLTAVVDVPRTASCGSYLFYQIGMLYRVHGCRSITCHGHGQGEGESEMQPLWVDLRILSENECSALLWKYSNSLYTPLRAGAELQRRDAENEEKT